MALYSRMHISMSAPQDCDVILRRFIAFMHLSFNCTMWGIHVNLGCYTSPRNLKVSTSGIKLLSRCIFGLRTGARVL